MFQIFFGEIDHWVFVLGCYYHDPCGLILINFLFFEKLEILGFEIDPNWGFCQIGLN